MNKDCALEKLIKECDELSKEEVINLLPGLQYIIYNPLINQIRIETASKKDIAHNKYCYNQLRFFREKGEKVDE